MRSVDVKSIKLKADAYQYQVVRFGNYRPQKPLGKAIARSRSNDLHQLLAGAHFISEHSCRVAGFPK